MKEEEKNFMCSKFQVLIQTLSYSGKIEYVCDTCGSQFTSRIMRLKPIHKIRVLRTSVSVPKQHILGPKTNQTN